MNGWRALIFVSHDGFFFSLSYSPPLTSTASSSFFRIFESYHQVTPILVTTAAAAAWTHLLCTSEWLQLRAHEILFASLSGLEVRKCLFLNDLPINGAHRCLSNFFDFYFVSQLTLCVWHVMRRTFEINGGDSMQCVSAISFTGFATFIRKSRSMPDI